MIIGYARVSTNDQKLTRQIDQLNAAGCERIYEEKISGKTKERPELQRMLEALRPGDIVVTAELTRLGRSVKDLFEIVDSIHSSGAEQTPGNCSGTYIRDHTALRGMICQD